MWMKNLKQLKLERTQASRMLGRQCEEVSTVQKVSQNYVNWDEVLNEKSCADNFGKIHEV